MSKTIDYIPAENDDVKTGWRFHSDENPAPPPWLIKNIFPQTGAGLISGQWGTYKTTVALNIAACTMTAIPFAGRFAIKRSGGVAYLALEGVGGLASRLTAIARTLGCSTALPFAYQSGCPALTAADALNKLTVLVEHAAQEIRNRFNVPIVLIIIDTIVTAAQYAQAGDDNDAAIAQRIMSVLSGLSQRTGALAVGIDHFGKVTDTGTRGSSAKEGHADVVLALLADRELNGTVTNTRLAVRKQRDGTVGIEIPFSPELLQIGTDEDGDPITRVIIDWDKQAINPTVADAGWSKSLRLLRQVLMTLLPDVGFEATPFADGPIVRAVNIELIRNEFYRQYPADGDEKKKADARRKAFYRAVNDARNKGLVATREVENVQLIWLTRAETL
jgi:AAA domain